MDKQKKLREFITRRHAKNVKGSYSSRRKMLTDGNVDLYKGMKSAPKGKFVSIRMSVKYLKPTRVKRQEASR